MARHEERESNLLARLSHPTPTASPLSSRLSQPNTSLASSTASTASRNKWRAGRDKSLPLTPIQEPFNTVLEFLQSRLVVVLRITDRFDGI